MGALGKLNLISVLFNAEIGILEISTLVSELFDIETFVQGKSI